MLWYQKIPITHSVVQVHHTESASKKFFSHLEIALFIVTPVPGSDIFEEFSGYTDYSQLNFSPTWRQDYKKINQFRVKLYGEFLWWKFRFHPLSILKQPFNFLLRNFNTKMEMTPYRVLLTVLMLKGLIGKRVQK